MEPHSLPPNTREEDKESPRSEIPEVMLHAIHRIWVVSPQAPVVGVKEAKRVHPISETKVLPWRYESCLNVAVPIYIYMLYV